MWYDSDSSDAHVKTICYKILFTDLIAHVMRVTIEIL